MPSKSFIIKLLSIQIIRRASTGTFSRCPIRASLPRSRCHPARSHSRQADSDSQTRRRVLQGWLRAASILNLSCQNSLPNKKSPKMILRGRGFMHVYPFFSHPDFTVGAGISPARPATAGSRTSDAKTPVTVGYELHIPRRTVTIIQLFCVFVNRGWVRIFWWRIISFLAYFYCGAIGQIDRRLFVQTK